MPNRNLPELTEYLKGFATEKRWQKIEAIAARRTRHISVVVEDIYQPHNASAVLRSCEGFGVQDVHIIENHNRFKPSSQVTIGADQWLSIHRYQEPETDNTQACFEVLQAKGYRILATTPHQNDMNLNEVPLNQKTAIVFGSEVDGISERAKELADGFVKIPMSGFSESFNISVSAAVSLYNLTRRLRESEIDWRLSEQEQEELKYLWLRQSIKAGKQLEQKFLQEKLKE